jgi:hypothetical protein
MIAILLIGVLVLTALVTLNLILLAAVIRRLREHAEQFAAIAPRPTSSLREGAEPPLLAATTVDDVFLGPDLFAGHPVTIAFFSAACEACRAHLREFLEWAGEAGPDGTVMIVSGDAADSADLVEPARRHTHVVVEESSGPITSGFEVEAFPCFIVMRDGVVNTVAASVRPLRQIVSSST